MINIKMVKLTTNVELNNMKKVSTCSLLTNRCSSLRAPWLTPFRDSILPVPVPSMRTMLLLQGNLSFILLFVGPPRYDLLLGLLGRRIYNTLLQSTDGSICQIGLIYCLDKKRKGSRKDSCVKEKDQSMSSLSSLG